MSEKLLPNRAVRLLVKILSEGSATAGPSDPDHHPVTDKLVQLGVARMDGKRVVPLPIDAQLTLCQDRKTGKFRAAVVATSVNATLYRSGWKSDRGEAVKLAQTYVRMRPLVVVSNSFLPLEVQT